MTEQEWLALRMSLLIAGGATLAGLPPGILLGWILARLRFPGRGLLELFLLLPLVMPPVVTGYFILLLFGHHGLFAPLLNAIGVEIVFTWKGMLVAGLASGMPLLVRAVRMAMEGVDPGLEQAAASLGFNRWHVFRSITLPLAWPGVLAGAVLAFARALGEFGATRMVSTNMAGSRTLPLEIFCQIENPASDGGVALWRLALLSVLLSGLALWLSNRLVQSSQKMGAGRD